ncbi:MAG: UDP-N-acetylmuramate--L-alanine ligase, partial [Caulobacteraceae bacterium]
MFRAPIPFAFGPVHFVGIGGAGMSAIAEMMLRLDYAVQGSDAKESAATRRLRSLGARVWIGHQAAQVEGASAVVFSTAIAADNPELAAARAQHIPLVRRAEMLAELMRQSHSIAVAGTHGKTTTTALVAALMEAGGLDPTVIVGGHVNAYGANAKLGAGQWMAVEADESDGSFLKLRPSVAVVTNIDPEHLDHWGDFAALKAGFRAFIETIPFYGFAVLCLDDPVVQELAAEIEDRRIVAYGTNPQAKVRLLDLAMTPAGAAFSVAVEDDEGGVETIEDLKLPMVGTHNVQNALAAIAIARRLGIGWEAVRNGLAGFAGVGRRFTRVGEVGGVTIIDDYAHHPT